MAQSNRMLSGSYGGFTPHGFLCDGESRSFRAVSATLVPPGQSRVSEAGFYPITRIQPIAYFTCMKNRIVTGAALSVFALSFLLVGCDRTVSTDKSSSVSSDGTVKSKEKTVTKSSDGTVTKTEETKKTEKP